MNTKKIKFVYILSQRYSGSTLLSFLLATHPDIATIGERRKFYTHAITDHSKSLICSCGEPFKNCPFWTSIKKSMLGDLGPKFFKRNHTEYRLIEQKHLNQVASRMYYEANRMGLNKFFPLHNRVAQSNQFNKLLIEKILESQQAEVFLDSSKTARHLLFLNEINALDLHIIWLTRDPRAQVCSSLKYNSHSIEQATQEWIKEMQVNQRFLRDLKLNNFHKLSYESLCRDPKKELDKVFDFIGLPKDYSTDFRSNTQHIMGNAGMRLGDDRKISERTDWVDKLSTDQIETIEKLTKKYQGYYSPSVPPKQSP